MATSFNQHSEIEDMTLLHVVFLAITWAFYILYIIFLFMLSLFPIAVLSWLSYSVLCGSFYRPGSKAGFNDTASKTLLWTFIGLAYVHLNAQILLALFAIKMTYGFRLVASLVVEGVFVGGFVVMLVASKRIVKLALSWLEKREHGYRGVGQSTRDLDGGASGNEGKSD